MQAEGEEGNQDHLEAVAMQAEGEEGNQITWRLWPCRLRVRRVTRITWELWDGRLRLGWVGCSFIALHSSLLWWCDNTRESELKSSPVTNTSTDDI